MTLEFTVFRGSKSGEIVETKTHREIGPREVAVDITHSGVCGTDEHFRHVDQGLGHEGVGVVTALGALVPEISDVKVGDRVGLGWFQKTCGYCKQCLLGHQIRCQNLEMFGSGNLDLGCFATGIVRDVSCVTKIPDDMLSEYAGPLMCGGITVWGPLYEHGARAGDRVGIVSVGGLGHLAIQFASKMGLEAVVFSASESKRDEAMAFGATEFHVIKEGQRVEGATPVDFLLITSSILPDLSLFLPVLATRAKIFPLTISFGSLSVPMMPMTTIGFSIHGAACTNAQSFHDMLSFAAKHGIRPRIEKFPMSQAGVTQAMARLKDGKVRYRAVLEA